MLKVDEIGSFQLIAYSQVCVEVFTEYLSCIVNTECLHMYSAVNLIQQSRGNPEK